MAFSYGVQGYGVPQEEPPPPNPFLGGGWDDSEAPPMLPQGEAFRSSGVSPDAADPFATTASAGSYAPAPALDWGPTGPLNPPPAPAADPMGQAQQTAFDRVFGGGGAATAVDPFSAPADRPNADGTALSPKDSLSEALRLNREQGQTDVTQAQMGADLMKRKSDFETNAQIEQEQYRAKYQASIEMAKQVSEQKIEAYKNLKPDTLFGSGSRGGERETTIALMILGGINDIMGNRQGQMSSAMQALQIGMKQLETDDSIRFGKALNEAKGAQRDQQTLEAQRDVGLAEIAHRNAARWKVVEDGVKAEIAQMAPGEARVKAEQNALTIQQKSAQESQRAQMAAVDLADKGMKLELERRKLRGTGSGGPAAPDPDDPEGRYRGMKPAQKFNAMAADAKLEAKDLDGNPVGRWASPALAVKGQKAQADANNLRDRLTELKGITEKEGTWDIPFTEAAQTRKNTIQPTVSLVGDLGNAGVLNKGEREAIEKLLDGGIWTSKAAATKGLETLDHIVAGAYNRFLQSGIQGKAPESLGGRGVGQAGPSAARPIQSSGGSRGAGGAPQEGETRTISGHTVTFTNGRWQ